MTLNEILEQAERYKAIDDERQEKLDSLTRSLCPSCHLPIVEPTLCIAFLKGACRGNRLLYDDFEYYFYEANRKGHWIVRDSEGREFDFKYRKQFLNYLTKNYESK